MTTFRKILLFSSLIGISGFYAADGMDLDPFDFSDSVYARPRQSEQKKNLSPEELRLKELRDAQQQKRKEFERQQQLERAALEEQIALQRQKDEFGPLINDIIIPMVGVIIDEKIKSYEKKILALQEDVDQLMTKNQQDKEDYQMAIDNVQCECDKKILEMERRLLKMEQYISQTSGNGKNSNVIIKEKISKTQYQRHHVNDQIKQLQYCDVNDQTKQLQCHPTQVQSNISYIQTNVPLAQKPFNALSQTSYMPVQTPRGTFYQSSNN